MQSILISKNNNILSKKNRFKSRKSVTIIFVILAIITSILYKEIIVIMMDNGIKSTNTSAFEKVMQRKELRVGMLRSLTRLYIDYHNPNKISGFDYAILEKFATSLNVKLKVIFANDLPELIAKSKAGHIDLIAAEIRGYSQEINNFVMSNPYYYITEQLVYRKGSTKPYTFDDITGNLTIPQYSRQHYILEYIKLDYPAINWNESSNLNQEELLKYVEDQHIDYTIADNKTIAIMQRIYPLLTVAFDVVDQYPKTWYFPNTPDKSLLNQANQFINKLLQDGTIEKLEHRYYSYIGQFDYVDTRAFIRAIDQVLPKYQPFFEKYAEKNKLDWKLIAAMAYQESHWNPKAISSTGVKGMMMLTKTTAESLGVKNRLNAEQSIKGGSEYLRQLINRMPNTIAKEERIWFALAAYNMGTGHLWDARKLAQTLGKNPNSWRDIRLILPLLSEEEYYCNLKYGSANGYQAAHFVDSIQQYYISLVGYLIEKQYRPQSPTKENTSKHSKIE